MSWDLTAKFKGLSPNVKELFLLAEKEGFSNIERIEPEMDGSGACYLVVNNRGKSQTEFHAEKVMNDVRVFGDSKEGDC